MIRRCLIPLAAGVVLAATSLQPAGATKGPPQPESGPGGRDYVAEKVERRGLGQAAAPVYVFHGANEPQEKRPVVVFLHAWGASNPALYGGWIEHLARRGNLVIFPRVQEIGRTRPADATAIALEMLRETLAALEEDEKAKPDLSRLVLVGHLAGAAIAANVASAAPQDESLPVPRVLYALMPGGIASDPKSRGIPLADLSGIDEGTLIATITGDRDHLPSQRQARRIHVEATRVPAENKVSLRALSDDHGYPSLVASLASPASPRSDYDAAAIKVPPDPANDPKVQRRTRQKWSADMALTGEQTRLAQQLASNPTDALDWMAYWRSLDMLMEAAFAGRTAADLRADTSLAGMGQWADGRPVRRLGVAEAPK